MSDIFTKTKRSEIMASVYNKNTRPEIKVRKYLFSQGFRYRVNDKKISCTPDIYLPKYKTVIFVMGVFGTGVKNANLRSCILPMLISGRIEYGKI